MQHRQTNKQHIYAGLRIGATNPCISLFALRLSLVSTSLNERSPSEVEARSTIHVPRSSVFAPRFSPIGFRSSAFNFPPSSFRLHLSSFIRHALLLLLIFSCSRQLEQVEETILARVGDKTISVNEFIRRAEYTPRPNYCRGENYIHRKIVLNSMIAEKLLALEAGADNELTRNDEFQLYMQGRKEQAMRQWFYQKEAVEKVRLDSAEIKKIYKVAGRTYNVSYLNCPNEEVAQAVNEQLRISGLSFEEVYFSLTGDTAGARREIRFDSPEPEPVNKALFDESVKVGQIIGPVKVDQNDFVFLHIDGWSSSVALSEAQQRDRLKTVTEKLNERQAIGIYETYIGKLMSGKRLDFEEETFTELVNTLGPEYFKTDQDKQEAFNKKFWNKDNEEMTLDDLPEKMSRLRDKKLLTIDGQTWTVADFEQAIKIHPLVFRNRKMPKNKFGEQFKFAVADMIRDRYITKDAYASGYDKVNLVQRDVNMWRDNLLALYQRIELLDSVSVSGKNALQIIEEYLDPHVAALREKYNAKIEINTAEFEKIKLTGIDMFVIQKNVAFPVIVPSFPQLTTHDKLDYGKKMAGEKK